MIVTRLPFVELFQELMAVIAPEFFDKGSICLEISAKEIDQWPRPVPGIVLNLPLLGTLFQVSFEFVFFVRLLEHLNNMELFSRVWSSWTCTGEDSKFLGSR